MRNASLSQPGAGKPLRLWPGVALAGLLIATYVLGLVAPGVELFSLTLDTIGLLGGVIFGAAIVIWWLLFSRVPWLERLGGVVLSVAALLVTRQFVDPSIANAGQSRLLFVFSIPLLALALVGWAAATRHLHSAAARRLALLGAVVLACVPWTMVRTPGVRGAGIEFEWRWTATPEERLLARGEEPVVPPPAAAAAASPSTAPAAPASANETPPAVPPSSTPANPGAAPSGDAAAKGPPRADATKPSTGPIAAPSPGKDASRAEWPGFRGPRRDGVVHGIRIATDWTSTPPMELWRRPIGPGWSSIAVHGDLLYTQEQRGDEEIVACYRVSTGEPVWRHRDATRFWESNGGPGPRATPTLHEGRVYSFGATGILNALDARSGDTLWSRNVAADTSRQVPYWGFASSPLVVGDLVVVAAAGTLAAYDQVTGAPRWRGPSYGGSYSSPHRVVLDGVEQIVLLGGPGAISVAPDGTRLWEYKWEPGPIVQPAVTADGDILINAITATGGTGTRRLHVARTASGWTVEERWTSNGLKPYFNDFVVHEGYAYGFDNNILAAIDLADGQRKWKGGRYGNGQMVLLADQDLLLVSSEDGELALVSAAPDGYREIARIQALEGKTWNHPVVVRDVLLVRNGEQMAAFRLPLVAASSTSSH